VTDHAVTAAPGSADPDASAWAPLRIRVFRWLWIAGLVSNLGTYMHNVGASWLVTELSRSPTVVALLQTVYAAPGFLFALIAGALADVVDRRKLLIGIQVVMLAAAAALGALTLTDHATVLWLLSLTFVISVGGTFNMPPWTSLTPEVVSRAELGPAVALNSVAGNIAQSVGPALAGVVIAAAGPGAVFVVNAVSFLAVVVVLASWRREPPLTSLPAEHIGAAVRSGARYLRNSPALLVGLARLGAVVAFTSAVPALLPVLARRRMGASAGQFGLLEASLGVGAVAMAVGLPKARAALGPDGVLLGGSLLAAAGMALAAGATGVGMGCLGLAVMGAGQITAMTTIFADYTGALPDWVRGRGLAVAMLVVWIVTSPFAVVWGAVATATSASSSILIAAVGLAASAVVLAPVARIGPMAGGDATPVPTTLEVTAAAPCPDDGPVLVTVEWDVDPARVAEFAEAMRPIHRQRRRDGAIRWGLYEDVERPGRMLESFEVASWAEHERQHGRSTAGDAEHQAAARSMLLDGREPVVTHLVAPRRHRDRRGLLLRRR
jgi:MFS family permease